MKNILAIFLLLIFISPPIFSQKKLNCKGHECATTMCVGFSNQVDNFKKAFFTKITYDWGQQYEKFLNDNEDALKCCYKKCTAPEACNILFRNPNIVIGGSINNITDINNDLKKLHISWIDVAKAIGDKSMLRRLQVYNTDAKISLLIENIGYIQKAFACAEN